MLKLSFAKIKPQLVPYIRKITLFDSMAAIDYTQKIMQSGYSYMSYNLKDIPTLFVGKELMKNDSRLQMIGPKTKNNIYVHHCGRIEQVLLEFTATGFYRLFMKSPAQYCNLSVSYADFLEQGKSHKLGKMLIGNHDIASIVNDIQNYLIKLANKAAEVDERISETILVMEKLEGVMSVQEAYQIANIGERHFNRLFGKIVGCSPKLFLKLLQLHQIISKMSGNSKAKMLDIAYLLGFYDQAHFNKSFKKLVSMSPGKFISSSEHVSLQYFKNKALT